MTVIILTHEKKKPTQNKTKRKKNPKKQKRDVLGKLIK